jgi:hypothetical protein
MMLFEGLLIVVTLLTLYQTILYVRAPRVHPSRGQMFIKILALIVIAGVISYAYRLALLKEVELKEMFPVYPEATMNIVKTPIFSHDAYWSYSTVASPDQIFNWYRSRTKGLGLQIVEEHVKEGKLFVVVLKEGKPRLQLFIALNISGKKTEIVYTTEGTMTLLHVP